MTQRQRLAPVFVVLGALLPGHGQATPGRAVAGPTPLATARVTLSAPAEIVLVLEVQCSRCSWARRGEEGAVLRVELNGRYSQHLVVPHGPTFTSRIGLGAPGPGTHEVSVSLDEKTPAPLVGAVAVTRVEAQVVGPDSPEFAALSHSPIIHARPDSLERFSDLPMVVWSSTEPSPRGTWIHYSVIFSNEDGGTPPDRLMATWGRLTDIEYVYGVEIDATGRVLAEEYQGPDHKYLPFEGAHEGGHPVLHVVTENNMVSDRGGAPYRFALAPTGFQIANASREVVMDASPWLYRVSSEELEREGRVDPAARPGSGKVPDPRRFVYVEACGVTEAAVIALDVGFAAEDGSLAWSPSDGLLPEFRVPLGGGRQKVERPYGCFRTAVAGPIGVSRPRALRWRAYTQPPRKEDPPLPPGSGRAHLTRINRVFQLGDDYLPGPNQFEWTGELAIPADGAPVSMTTGR